jgi:predicted metal-binding protein
MRSLVFCTTCRYSSETQLGPEGLTGGEMLALAMEALVRAGGRQDVQIERQACLWSCTRHCNVLIRDSRRYSYLAGGFAPGREAAQAILSWFDLHGASPTGEVPFRTWPQGMRGHFIARLPPDKP